VSCTPCFKNIKRTAQFFQGHTGSVFSRIGFVQFPQDIAGTIDGRPARNHAWNVSSGTDVKGAPVTLTLEMITLDCVDPRRLAQWWAEAVGGSVVNLPGGDFVLVARENWPALGFQRVADPTPGKNRVHLDLMAPDLDADVERTADGESDRLAQVAGACVFGWQSGRRFVWGYQHQVHCG
jgi:hypothetical protein